MVKIYHRDDGVKEPSIFDEPLSINSWLHEFFDRFRKEFCKECIEPICLAAYIPPKVDPDNPDHTKFGIYCPKWTNDIDGTNEGYLKSAMYTENNILNHKEIEK